MANSQLYKPVTGTMAPMTRRTYDFEIDPSGLELDRDWAFPPLEPSRDSV